MVSVMNLILTILSINHNNVTFQHGSDNLAAFVAFFMLVTIEAVVVKVASFQEQMIYDNIDALSIIDIFLHRDEFD